MPRHAKDKVDAFGTSPLSYPGTLAMLAVAIAFPICLMVFNPTLMFERGWEQYVGTSIYFWAVIALSRELIRLWRNEASFAEGPGWIGSKDEGLIKAARSTMGTSASCQTAFGSSPNSPMRASRHRSAS